ncbi:MAG: FAD-dependent oxidoreductase [Bacteroidetes bacterium]|nr:FAD-dependent oxidoreductase [Bacteroidota bacterium]
MKNQSYEYTCDILIVGAGVAGLFAASRLLENNPSLKVVIVEKLNRTGGRLQTTTVPIRGADGKYYDVKNEEGGMRFCEEGKGMPNLWTLINTLNLQPVPFPMGDHHNRYYFRGKSFTRKETPGMWKKLFHLAPREQDRQPADIFNEIMQTILDENKGYNRHLNKDNLPPSTPEEWITFRNEFTFQGTLINEWGFWALLRSYGLTQECISWLDRAIGFMGPIDSFINAGEGMQIILDFPNTPTFFTLPDGYQSLTDHLAARVQRFGGEIILDETILSVNREGQNIHIAGTQTHYKAKKVILAVPRNALESLAESSPIIQSNHQFMEAVGSVHNMELSKIGLYFDHRWWHDRSLHHAIHISSGPSFSDLPAGSVYAFACYPENPTEDEKYVGPAALTVYTDFIRGNFWKEMQNIGAPYRTEAFPENPENTTAASAPLVEEVMRQIKTIFGLDPDAEVPAPVLSTYRVWGQGQFGYGYHQYKINVNDQNLYDVVKSPAENVYVCNEAWSPEQGWVEGALLATDRVLQKDFALPPYTTSKHKKSDSLHKSLYINQY